MKTRTAKSREIGSRIKLARHEAGGMTQRELADLLHVTERSVAAYETGEVIPYRLMPQLESALGRTASWFLYGDEATAPQDTTMREILASLARIENILSSKIL